MFNSINIAFFVGFAIVAVTVIFSSGDTRGNSAPETAVVLGMVSLPDLDRAVAAKGK